MFNKTENNNLNSKYGLLLLKTLNKYLQENSQSLLADIAIDQLLTFLDILTKYSSIFYFKKKTDYSKLIIKFGIDCINQSKYQSSLEVLTRKSFLLNNMICVHDQRHEYDKAEQFYNRMNELSYTAIDKAITFNNLGLIELKQHRTKAAVNYFHLLYKELEERLNASFSQSQRNIIETISFLMLNYCIVLSKFTSKDIVSIHSKAYNFSRNNLGEDHYLTIKYLAIKEKDSFNSSDSSPQTSEMKNSESRYDNKDIEISEEIIITPKKKENSTHSVPHTELEVIKEKLTLEMTKADESPKANNILTEDNKMTTGQKLTEEKRTTTLQLQPAKPKRTLKDMLSKVVKPRQEEKSKLDTLLEIGRQLKQQEELAKQKEKLNDKLNQRQKNPTNKTQSITYYNDQMSKYSEVKDCKLELLPLPNTNNASQSLKNLRPNESKRVSVQLTPNTLKKLVSNRSKSIINPTQYFQKLLLPDQCIKMPNADLIEQIDCFDTYEGLNNFYKKKNEHKEDEIAEVRRIIDNSKESTHVVETKIMQWIESIDKKVIISLKNQDSSKTIKILIQGDNVIDSHEITYEDIYNCHMDKIILDFSLPLHCNLSFIPDMTAFIQTIFIKHCSVYYLVESNTYDLRILPEQQNFNGRQVFGFTFMKTDCCFNLTITAREKYLIIYMKEDSHVMIRFDLTIDNESFEALFIESNAKDIISYDYKDKAFSQQYFSRLFINLQNFFTVKMSLKDDNTAPMTFKEIVEYYSLSVFKLNIEDYTNYQEIWLITKDSNDFAWRIEMYSLVPKKMQEDSVYIDISLDLNSIDFVNIIGAEPTEIMEFMNDRDIKTIQKILLSTIKRRDIASNVLKKENYKIMLSLLKITPICFFSFKFAVNYNKKYFCCAFEYIYYSKECSFLRLMIIETITSRSYAKIYLPYYMNDFIPSWFIGTEKEKVRMINEEMKWIKTLKENKKEMKSVLNEEVLNILKVEVDLILFENMDLIINKLLSKKTSY